MRSTRTRRKAARRVAKTLGVRRSKVLSLLHDIQAAVLQDDADLGPILLKLRLLAARLGSQPLAEWVKHESEGYPPETKIPDYRILSVSYTANFSGPFGSGIQNAPISPYLVEKFAGKQWVRYEMRDSIAAVDDLLTARHQRRESHSAAAGQGLPRLRLQLRKWNDIALGACSYQTFRPEQGARAHD